MPFSTYEGLARLAHRVAVSENERVELEAAFLTAFGSDDEKKMYYKETESDRQKREAQEKFDAAVAAEVQSREKAKLDEAAVKAAADAAQAAPVNPTPVTASA